MTVEPRAFDEMKLANGEVRQAYARLSSWRDGLSRPVLDRLAAEAEAYLLHRDFMPPPDPLRNGKADQVVFDPVPGILAAEEWSVLARGAAQRVRALNRFLDDIYHGAEIVRSQRLPAEVVFENPLYQVHMHGFGVPRGIYAAVASVDVVRMGGNRFAAVGEDLEAPSGIARMVEMRTLMEHLCSDLVEDHVVVPLETCGDRLRRTFRALVPDEVPDPLVVQLSSGGCGEDWFEDVSLAGMTGAEIVSASDLQVWNGRINVRTTSGPAPVDVMLRSLDDDRLDPLVLDASSNQGVAGLVSVYRSGGLALVNAMGTAIVSHPAVRRFAPDIIRFYLDEEPVLESLAGRRQDETEERSGISDLWKACQAAPRSGGRRDEMPDSPDVGGERGTATAPDRCDVPKPFAPRLSLCSEWTGSAQEQRPVILRIFVLSSGNIEVLPGALTFLASGSATADASKTVALKDTWVLRS